MKIALIIKKEISSDIRENLPKSLKMWMLSPEGLMRESKTRLGGERPSRGGGTVPCQKISGNQQGEGSNRYRGTNEGEQGFFGSKAGTF